MKRKIVLVSAAIVFAAFLVFLAGCEGTGSPAVGNGVCTLSWSGPHAIPDAFDTIRYTIGNEMLMAVGSQHGGSGQSLLVKTSTTGRSWENVTSYFR